LNVGKNPPQKKSLLEKIPPGKISPGKNPPNGK
jgi:hypothetical protein